MIGSTVTGKTYLSFAVFIVGDTCIERCVMIIIITRPKGSKEAFEAAGSLAAIIYATTEQSVSAAASKQKEMGGIFKSMIPTASQGLTMQWDGLLFHCVSSSCFSFVPKCLHFSLDFDPALAVCIDELPVTPSFA